jgi:hypothetical protein
MVALAAPIGKRADADILVYTFADVLEQLESQFYQKAIEKFQPADFETAGFSPAQLAVEQFTIIQGDEAAHSTAIQAALKSFGAEPLTSCTFNFDSALTDVATMAATGRVVENLGVAAYLGGATLLTDPVLLDAAASILTIEARHQTILNIMSGSGTAIPSAFDIAFSPSEVLAVAAPFFDGPCDLGIPANPTLAVANTGSIGPGTLLTFTSDAINGTVPEDQLHCQMMIGGAAVSIPLKMSECVVPDDINGPVAIWITSDDQPLVNNVRDRATTQLVAGPTMAFIDTQPQMLGQLARKIGSGGAPSGETITTQTISPEEASSLIATATGSADTAGETAPAGNAGAAPGLTQGPNLTTGKSPDGKLTVIGWTGL